MLTEHDISPIELSLLFSPWVLIGIITEIPSGALAARLGRKWLINVVSLTLGLPGFSPPS